MCTFMGLLCAAELLKAPTACKMLENMDCHHFKRVCLYMYVLCEYACAIALCFTVN